MLLDDMQQDQRPNGFMAGVRWISESWANGRKSNGNRIVQAVSSPAHPLSGLPPLRLRLSRLSAAQRFAQEHGGLRLPRLPPQDKPRLHILCPKACSPLEDARHLFFADYSDNPFPYCLVALFLFNIFISQYTL